MFLLDQRQKIGTKVQMQISGLDCKAKTKITKTLERKVLFYAQETFIKVDSLSDSDLDFTILLADNLTKSNDSLISDEPYLPLNASLAKNCVFYRPFNQDIF